ncbi:hypothetical protein VR46_45135 [Streptomyces sp. NRRL S-444]|nr:hypothetical protein VR46_45135 [Streptomyces sp. NRRL S-444]
MIKSRLGAHGYSARQRSADLGLTERAVWSLWYGGVYSASGPVEQGRELEGEVLGVGRAGLLPLTIPADQTTP